jgi:hypothetical protein
MGFEIYKNEKSKLPTLICLKIRLKTYELRKKWTEIF